MSTAIVANPRTRNGESAKVRTAATARSNTRLASGYGTPPAPFATPGSDGRRIVCDIDRLPVRVDVERLGPRLAPAGARVLLAAERDVRLEAVGGPVDLDTPGDDAAGELLAAVDAGRPDRRRQAVRAPVR